MDTPTTRIDQPFERTLGRMVMNFGAIEYLVLVGIATLARKEPAATKTRKLPDKFTQRLTLFNQLARRYLKDAALLEEHRYLVSSAREYAKTRNQYVHGAWLDMHPDLDAVKHKIVKKDATIQDFLTGVPCVPLTPKQIADVANQMNALIERFRTFLRAIGAD